MFEEIAEDIRLRIVSGKLRPGDRVPSIRQVSERWGVAHATATKAMGILREMGLVEGAPGGHTRVAGAPGGTPARLIARKRIVEAAIGIADERGLAAASMRAIASKIDNSAMSSYYHVRDRSELLGLMAETALAEAVPSDKTSEGARFEVVAQALWDAYRRHPWLSQVDVERFSRSPVVLAQAEWATCALIMRGLDRASAVRYHHFLHSFVRGVAGYLQVGSGRQVGQPVPRAGAGLEDAGDRVDADDLFEWGLRVLLDGMEQAGSAGVDRGSGNGATNE